MSSGEWKKRCEDEWGLEGAPMPDSVDWRSVYEAKPFNRNLLKNPSPYVVRHDSGTGEGGLSEVPARRGLCIPGFIEGDFSDWTTSTEDIPSDLSGIPKGAVVCAVPKYSWYTMEQTVDLKAEGLWEELLDEFQPEIFIQEWYEESCLHEFIYQLHVRLLGADKTSVIAEHTYNPTEERGVYSRNHKWKEVSHVFSGYGPGVRQVHFLHRLKNQFLNGFYTTASSGSSVIVRPVKSH
ncbi:F-box only protein 50-like [Boleophthalmus pectinirostris]|uniref:F-box only protein 50-like n=1 Tax=Boleophthalmus pectinirostris TaxID=150288 RepID=UPI000A1C4BBA|nr:F-box only protein 50-like [Boleophthalmus pectinirostris]